jgi:hypothetical protein
MSMNRMTHVPLHTLLAASVAVLAACSGTPADPSGDAPPVTLEAVPTAPAVATQAEPTDGPAAGADLAAFCELGTPMLIPVEREHVGSEAHVAQFAALGEVAPEDLVEVIANLEQHYDVAVSPSDPDSQNYENFPPGIQDDARVLVEAIEERCGAAE